MVGDGGWKRRRSAGSESASCEHVAIYLKKLVRHFKSNPPHYSSPLHSFYTNILGLHYRTNQKLLHNLLERSHIRNQKLDFGPQQRQQFKSPLSRSFERVKNDRHL